ncbi:hypothetical protein N9L48_07335 [Psychrosphaera sp.]|nr:hypothetical protein [Psychrosphaera sp.]
MVISKTVVETYKELSQRPVNQFYKKHKQNVSTCSKDIIIIARKLDDCRGNKITETVNIAGAALIRNMGSNEKPIYLFRSLFVGPVFRSNQLGTLITAFAQNILPKSPLYTLCENQLISFYKAQQFEVCLNTPNELAKLNAKKNLTLLVRL